MTFVIRSLMPYTKENLLLAFSPNRFFNELEKTSNYTKNTIRSSYYRAKQQGYIANDKNFIKITNEGLTIVRPFRAKKLKGNSRLMLIFDIPEQQLAKRNKLRRLVKSWDFKQVQKSVWITDRDYEDVVISSLKELGLKKCVELHESVRIFPK